MYTNPRDDYEKGFNAGFWAHQHHVAHGQIKRIEKANKAKEEQLQAKIDQFNKSIANKEAFDLFCELLKKIQKTDLRKD